MSWTSSGVTQNGNTTLIWTLGPHPVVSEHDVIVIRVAAGGGAPRIRINSVTVGLPAVPRLAGTGLAFYEVSVSTIGAGPVAFRFSGMAID
jgi:hypothetical protein